MNFDDALRRFAAELIDSMHAAGGIGLAAQQVGRAVQLCAVDLRASDAEYEWALDGKKPPKELFMPFVMANPQVGAQPDSAEKVAEEGCLSFPEIRGDVHRPDTILARYKDEFGVAHKLACNGLLARCIQHEVDHLNGILFIDRMDRKTRGVVDAAVKALAKKTREESRQGAR